MHEYIPNRNDMTDTSNKHKEVEDSVHEVSAESIENSTGDVADSLGDNPDDGSCADAVDKWLEGNEYAQTHQTEAERLEIAVGT